MPRESFPAFLRGQLPILPVPAFTGIFDGTGAITLIDSFVPGFRLAVEKLVFVSGSIATGAGGTQTFKLRKGGATGTVLATLTLALADINAVGKFKSAAVPATEDDEAQIIDTDSLSLTRDSGGTAFTKAEGIFYVVYRQRPQARQ